MINFLINNWGTIVVGLIVLAIVSAIIRMMIRKRKAGKPITCDCGGESCGNMCHGCTPLPESLTNDDMQFPT